MYYGTDLVKGTDIQKDRRELSENSHCRNIIGTRGTGKTFLVKAEIVTVLQNYKDDTVFVFDCYGEYNQMAETYKGKTITVSSKEQTIDLSDAKGLVIFDLTGVGQSEMTKAYLLCLRETWDFIKQERASEGRRWIYIEEMYNIIKDENLSKLADVIVTQARANKCLVTYSAMSLCELAENEHGKTILMNTPFVTLLSLTPRNDEKEMLQQLYGDVSCGEEVINAVFKKDAFAYTGLLSTNRRTFTPFGYYTSRKGD